MTMTHRVAIDAQIPINNGEDWDVYIARVDGIAKRLVEALPPGTSYDCDVHTRAVTPSGYRPPANFTPDL